MSFQFIHAADLHIDSPMRGLDRHADAPVEEIRSATRRAFENLIDTAVEQGVDFVLLAGDVFDDDWRDFHTGLFFTEQIARLKHAGIPVFIIHGNHDSEGGMTKRLPLPDNAIVFDSRKPETHRLDDIQVAIHGQSFPERHVPEDLVSDYPGPVQGWFNIGMLHTSLDGREGHADYAPTTAQKLIDKDYDYWALGHVHKREIVSETPWISFPGNLQGRRVKESGSKGFDLVSVSDDGAIQAEHVSADVVRWHQITLDCSEIETQAELKRAVTELIPRHIGSDDDRLHAVRVIVEGQSALYVEEAKSPGLLAATVRAASYEIDHFDLWIEKVRNALKPTIDRDHEAKREDAIGELVGLSNVIASSPENLKEFIEQELQTGLDAMPAELRSLEVLLEGQDYRQLLLDAEATIHATLTSVEEAEK